MSELMALSRPSEWCSTMPTSDFSHPTDGDPPPDSARLHLMSAHPSGGAQTTLDGAWWPRSRELAREVPLLVEQFAELGIRVNRVVYHPQLWMIAPTKVHVAGRRVHLGWFREIDPHLVSLRTSQGDRIELLVIPPETTADSAARASEAAAEPGNKRSPTEVLADAAAVHIAEQS
jgi:Family of unknown function (DUF5994)